MPYVTITKEQFEDYYRNHFVGDFQYFCDNYLRKDCRDAVAFPMYRLYILKRDIGGDKGLPYSGANKTTPENGCMFVVSVLYIQTFYSCLDYFSTYWIDKNLSLYKHDDLCEMLSNRTGLPLVYINQEKIIMNPIFYMRMFSLYGLGKRSKDSIVETIEKTRDFFREQIEFYCDRIYFNERWFNCTVDEMFSLFSIELDKQIILLRKFLF